MTVTGVRSREPIFPLETARGSKCEDNIGGGSMKLMSIILSFAILLTGCYSQQATRAVLDDRDVVFWLNDGSYIKVEAGAHHRVFGGYDVKGTHVTKDSTQGFEGIVRESQIKGMTSREFDVTATLIVVGVPILVLVVVLLGQNMSFRNMSLGSFS